MTSYALLLLLLAWEPPWPGFPIEGKHISFGPLYPPYERWDLRGWNDERLLPARFKWFPRPDRHFHPPDSRWSYGAWAYG